MFQQLILLSKQNQNNISLFISVIKRHAIELISF